MTKRQAAAIWAIYREMGGKNIRMLDLAKVVRDRGIFSEEELEGAELERIARDCKRVLNEPDPETGLPRAQPNPDDEWTQLDLMDIEEAESMIARRFQGIEEDYANALRLIDWFIERFGRRPRVQLRIEFPPRKGGQ